MGWGVIVRLRCAIAAIGILAGLCAASAGEIKIYSGITHQQLRSLLDGKNFRYRLEGDLVVLESGLAILATDCVNDNNACNEIRFSRSFSNVFPPLDAVNEWNRRFKVPEASIDAEGRLRLEMWLSGIGMTDTIFFDTLGWFERSWDTDGYWRKYLKGRPSV